MSTDGDQSAALRSAAAPFRLDFRLLAAFAVSLLLLLGCARGGDFGRFASEEADLIIGPAGEPIYTGAVPGVPFTDEERQLRLLANNLLAGPYQRGHTFPGCRKKGGVPSENGAPPELYAALLVTGPFRSTSARYARLIDDTRSDVVRLEQFFTIARRVADLDRKRQRSFEHVSNLSMEELRLAERRVRENMMLMTEVHHALNERAATYRFALERLVVAAPSPMAADAERTRGELERQLASVQVVGGNGPPATAAVALR